MHPRDKIGAIVFTDSCIDPAAATGIKELSCLLITLLIASRNMNFKIGIMLGLAILCSIQEADAAFGWYWYTAKQNNKPKDQYSEHENALSFLTKTPKEAIEAVELSVEQGFSKISENGKLTEDGARMGTARIS